MPAWSCLPIRVCSWCLMFSLTTKACRRCPSSSCSCGVPYRIDISCPPHDVLDQLVQLGALDIEPVGDGVAAIIPDGVMPDAVARALGVASVVVSPAVGRDNNS